jgi:hypothetical protein
MYLARKRQLGVEHALTGEPEWKIIDRALNMYFEAKRSTNEKQERGGKHGNIEPHA